MYKTEERNNRISSYLNLKCPPVFYVLLIPKARPLCTGAESNLADTVSGEVLIEKNSFIALPGKGGHRGLLPLKTMCLHLGGFDEEFYSISSRVGLLTRLGCVWCGQVEAAGTSSYPRWLVS